MHVKYQGVLQNVLTVNEGMMINQGKKRKRKAYITCQLLRLCVCVFTHVCMFECMWGSQDNPLFTLICLLVLFETGIFPGLEHPVSPKGLPVLSVSVLRLQVQATIPSVATLLGFCTGKRAFNTCAGGGHFPFKSHLHISYRSGGPRGTQTKPLSLFLVAHQN